MTTHLELTDAVYRQITSTKARTTMLVDRVYDGLYRAEPDGDLSDIRRDIEEAIENLYEMLLVIDPENDLLDAIRA